jgi:hypothetical protein
MFLTFFCFGGVDHAVQELCFGDTAESVSIWNAGKQGITQERSGGTGANHYVRPEGAEFGGETALGVDLEIEQSAGDGGSCAESEENDEQASTICPKETTNNAPEHRSIARAKRGHHSPRKMGAGS